MRAALGNAYSILDCKKAIASNNGDMHKSAVWLTDGEWRKFKMIKWNEDSIKESCSLLQMEFKGSKIDVRDVLLNCSGDIDLARKKLKGLKLIG